jgi:hypothetical protein
MRVSTKSTKLLAAIFACFCGCVSVSINVAASVAAAEFMSAAKFDRQLVFYSLQLEKTVFLSAMRLPVILPDEPGQADSLSANANLSLASSSILPLLSAPADLYSTLKANTLVQIIADVEIADAAISDAARLDAAALHAKADDIRSREPKFGDTKRLVKSLIVTLQNDSPALLRLAQAARKETIGHHQNFDSCQMEWQGEGTHWYADALDGKHLLVTNDPQQLKQIKDRFTTVAGKNAMPFLSYELPQRMIELLADVGDPELWQVLDTSIVNDITIENARSLSEFAKDKTAIVSFIEPGSQAFKTIVSSLSKTAPDMICRELNDFKEPAQFVLTRIADNKFSITISGADRKSIKAKVFLLLLTGSLSAS